MAALMRLRASVCAQAELPGSWGDAPPDAASGFAHRFELAGAPRRATPRSPGIVAQCR